jgi:hypothetical protein
MNKDTFKKYINRNRKKLLSEYKNSNGNTIYMVDYGNRYIIELKADKKHRRNKKLFESKNQEQCANEFFKICKYLENNNL